MDTIQSLVVTTPASQADTTGFPKIDNLVIDVDEPTGTVTKYLLKSGSGNWQKYDTSASAWRDADTQTLTAASVLSEGNTAAEINALAAAAYTGFEKKTLDVAAGLQTVSDARPTLRSITVNGEQGTTVKEETVPYGPVTLNSKNAVDIVNITVTKKETGRGIVKVLASVQDDSDSWSEYKDYTEYLGDIPTKAKAIAFRAVFSVVDVGTDTATLQSIEVCSRTDSVAVFTEGTSVCLTKTYDFVNVMSRAHLAVQHHIVPDTKITAQIALRNPSTKVAGELLGTGDGKQHTVKVQHLENLASHGFHLYFDGEEQARDTYSFSPTDGQVTYTAANGATVTVDYIYDWSPEKFVDMEFDNTYPDQKDDTLVTEQFDYEATTPDMSTGSVGTVRITMVQEKGTEKDVALGTGTGKPVSYKLAHHATKGKITVSPETAEWKWKETTDYLTVTAAAGEAVTVTYDWVARPLALESMTCVFDE